MKIREKWLGLMLIPFINTVNYYLTYNNYSLLTYSIDTVQGWIVWYAGRALILKLDDWYPYEKGVLRRILLQVLLTNILMLLLIIFMTWGVNALWGDRPLPISFYTENLLIFFIWILVFNGIYIGIHFYRAAKRKTPGSSQRIAARLGKQQVFLEESGILFFKSESDLVIAVDRQGKTWYLDRSLRLLEKDRSGQFFRANRQYLLHRHAVKGFQPGENGKLLVRITVADEREEEITVSRTKAAAFRKWLDD